jgi:hypothetical protein
VLTIGDIHSPYHHKDVLRFLEAIKEQYNPDRVVNLGDEADNHAISFHQSDPSLFSATKELIETQKFLRKLEGIFPEMLIVKSNHGSLIHRRVVAAGLPAGVIKSYNDIYGVGDGWQWKFDFTLTMSNRQPVYFVHMKSANAMQVSKNMGMNIVQGHYHSKASIHYWANPRNLFWGMQLGCLFDIKSMAYAYNKAQKDRPILTAGIIIDGQPKLLPMVLKKNGRWNGRVY